MKGNTKHIFFFLVSVLFFIVAFAQTKNEQIKSIRKKFETINRDTTLRKITLENEEFLINMPDGGGELTGYYKSKEIKNSKDIVE